MYVKAVASIFKPLKVGSKGKVFFKRGLPNCLTAGEPYIAYGIAPLFARIQASFFESGDMVSNSAPRHSNFPA